MINSVYEEIKEILTYHPDTRNSDKKLIWRYWKNLGILEVKDGSYYISEERFMEAPSTETIRRCRQAIQASDPFLQPTDPKIRKARKFKEENWNQMFHETTGGQLQAL